MIYLQPDMRNFIGLSKEEQMLIIFDLTHRVVEYPNLAYRTQWINQSRLWINLKALELEEETPEYEAM